MGKFNEQSIEEPDDLAAWLDGDDMSDDELSDLQRQVALSDVTFSRDHVAELCDRMKYYGENVGLDTLEFIRDNLTNAVRTLE